MSLTSGQTLSQYEILGPLGAGGMGEVWRARDTRLAREVAIKVLPADVAADEDRLRRFEREARALASLSHPHVAQVFGIDTVDGTTFMAMELVPGEDLAVRLRSGPLPVDETLDIGRQIAEGLEAAHEAGVVHRDLKPANVQLTPDGTIKLLDFGLAKAVGPQSESGEVSHAEPDSALVTEEGRVLGTPVYMSPEQARGKVVDRRTDLWALGCVLFECLVGKRPFGGRSAGDVLAAVLKDEPDWDLLPAIPPRLDELLRRCLQKDARMRLRDAGEARVQLQLALSEEPASTANLSPGAGDSPTRGVLLGLAGLVVGTAIGVYGFTSGARGDDAMPGDAGSAAGTASDVRTPEGADHSAPARRIKFRLAGFERDQFLENLALSPDGSAVAWSGPKGLRIHRLDELDTRELTDGSQQVAKLAWSPDSSELAWAHEDAVWRTTAQGGSPIRAFSLGSDDGPVTGLGWADQDHMLVLHTESTLYSRSVRTGAATKLFSLSDTYDPKNHLDSPLLFPGGELIAILHALGDQRNQLITWSDGAFATLATLPDWDVSHLGYSDGRLYLCNQVTDDVRWWWVDWTPGSTAPLPEFTPTELTFTDVAFASGGTLATVVQDGEAESQLARIDLDGSVTLLGRRHTGAVFPAERSVNGHLLFGSMVQSSMTARVWSYDLERGVSRFLLESEGAMPLAVMLDDGRFALSSFRQQEARAYSPTGTPEDELLAEGIVICASSDGRRIGILQSSGATSGTLSVDLLDDDQEPFVIRAKARDGPFSLRLSPDGRWALFVSDESGEDQIYLTPIPPTGQEWQVSVDGARAGLFTPDGKTILLSNGNLLSQQLNTIVKRVSFSAEPDVTLGLPETLFSIEDQAIMILGVDPSGESLYGSVRHNPVARDLVIETGWSPHD